jgi:hypothetical protein
VRRLIYTTNALESVHAQLRKIIKTRGQFPTDDAATKLIWLALRNITAKWARSSPYWRPAMNQLAILYEGRFPRRRRKCEPRMDAAGAVDAQNAPTAPCKPHRTRFPTAPTRIISPRALHTKFRTLPTNLRRQPDSAWNRLTTETDD